MLPKTFLFILIATYALCAANIRSAEIDLKPGATIHQVAAGLTEISYHVAVPTQYDPTKPAPLLILFSPSGKGDRILKPVAPATQKYGWLAVGVNDLRNGVQDLRRMRQMEDEALNDIFERIPHDPERLYLGGLSGGAMRAYSLTVRRKETFAGIMAIGGWLGGTQYARRKYPRNLAVAMIAGDKDLGAHQWSRHDATVFNRLGGRVQMFVFPGGHEMAPTGIIKQAIKWLNQDWRDYH